MSEEYVRDASGRILGRMITESNGDVKLLDGNGRYKGQWYKASGVVIDEHMRTVGRSLAALGMLLRD